MRIQIVNRYLMRLRGKYLGNFTSVKVNPKRAPSGLGTEGHCHDPGFSERLLKQMTQGTFGFCCFRRLSLMIHSSPWFFAPEMERKSS
jgi:hypothetical protein